MVDAPALRPPARPASTPCAPGPPAGCACLPLLQPSAESLHATAALFAPKPEITHAHRAPERRAPVLVSLLFTAATLLPLAGFLLALVRLGANAKVRLYPHALHSACLGPHMC